MNIKSLKALLIRESFQEIYQAGTVVSFESLLKKRYFWATHCRLEPIKQAAYTIKRHWDGVVSWKRSQITNGILEGLNSLIQAAKAKARGFRTFKCFRLIAFLITGKLNFNLINPTYAPL
jgi:transposase